MDLNSPQMRSLLKQLTPPDPKSVKVVLGPTNTGKTHYAIERLLAHPSGLIGLPLRLLAREVYGKLIEKLGVEKVALITGEEKIKPKTALYTVSTVEAMPQDLSVSIVILDEIQLCNDLERGHIFTDRLLNLRGRNETLLLGAETMRGIVQKLLPQATILSRERLSTLSFAGEKKITRLPPRSAIVAFSSNEVYEIAELVRRQHGGAAIVMGSLSPRTRNAQVALFQNREVDYLIATDAIGMGLNLDVEHVAFAGSRKFDGFQYRQLNVSEMAQIAGRAGRYNNNGTFGTTGRCEPFDQDTVQRLEAHDLEAVKILQWRNRTLDFSSLTALLHSLDKIPKFEGLTRALEGEDQRLLLQAARRPDLTDLLKSSKEIELLWQCCLMPDYRKLSPAAHADLAFTIFEFLVTQKHIPESWFKQNVAECTSTAGDIDTLTARIARIRTWAFIANQPFWLKATDFWQNTTRTIEDSLSDALHERLTARFLDKRTALLMRRLKDKTMIEALVAKSGEVTIEDQAVGHIEGFLFTPDTNAQGIDMKTLRQAASSALMREIGFRAEKLSEGGDIDFIWDSSNTIRWLGQAVARLEKGADALSPQLRILCDEYLSGEAKDKVEARLKLYVNAQIEKNLSGLKGLETNLSLQGLAKGIAFQVKENLGLMSRKALQTEIKELEPENRQGLRKNGIRIGAYSVFMPLLLKPASRSLSLQLWSLYSGIEDKGVSELPAQLLSGRTSLPRDAEICDMAYSMAGFRAFKARAVRVDILERIADIIRPALAYKPLLEGERPEGFIEGGFTVTQSMMSLAGAAGDDFSDILLGLGYKCEKRVKPLEGAPPIEGEDVAPVEVVEAAEPKEPEMIEVWSQAKFERRERPAQETKNADDKPKYKPYYQKLDAEGNPIQAERKPFEKKPFDKTKFNKFKLKDKQEGETSEGDKPKFEKKPFVKPKYDKLKFEKPQFEKPVKKEKPVDMDSPFAKLLALKEKLG
jgi:ATP-dependent RNA helicase SUPV3L1/SUV3